MPSPSINILDHRTDENQASLVKAFDSAKGLDKGRATFAKELGIHSVSEL